MALLQEIKVPLLAVNDTSLTVVAMSFSSGEKVKKGDLLMVFETSKTTYDVEAEADGYIQYFCETGNDYEVNELVAKIFDDLYEMEQVKPVTIIVPAVSGNGIHQPASAVLSHWEGETVFSEEASRLLASSGIALSLFEGKDFVSKKDVEEILGIKQKPVVRAGTAQPVQNKIKPAAAVDNERLIIEKLSTGKKREIEYLSDIQSTGLTSTINTSVETGGIFVHVNESLAYLKNSLLPLIVYETARLLKKYTVLNAYYTPGGIALYKDVNVGFAIDIDKGLKVLKLPLTNETNLAEIEGAIMHLSEKYLDDKLDIADLTEIGFTITDLSAEGVNFFKPLVNTMNSAILGVSSIDEKLDRCILSVTFDHRVTEGKTVEQFLKELKDRLESYRADAIYKTKDITCFKCYTTLAEDLGDTGFVHCVKPDGKDGYICQRCFKGF